MWENSIDREDQPVKTLLNVCSGLGSIFQIFPLTVNQSLEIGNISSFKGSVLTFCFFVNFPFTIYLKKKTRNSA